MAFAMASLCCLLTACSDDDNDDTPQQPITSGTFTYLFAFNKDILQWSDFSLTLTPSKGSPVTTSLNDPFNRKLDEMLEYEKYLLDPSTMVLPGRLHDYVFYSVPMSVTEFPMTINVKLNWKVKDGYQAQDNDFYTVTLVEAYGVSTNTNQKLCQLPARLQILRHPGQAPCRVRPGTLQLRRDPHPDGRKQQGSGQA